MKSIDSGIEKKGIHEKEVLNMIENIENKSFNELEILASKDNLEALNELGYRYLYGIGTAINYNLAFEYYNAVVKLNRNNSTAKCALAYLYYTGKGTEQNLNSAYQLFKELVDEHQYEDAYYYLGNYYYFGIDGIEKDYQKAYEYFNKSIEYRRHIYRSKFNLGEMYLQGLYVNKDIEQAVKYFEDILTEEYDDTYYKLAEIYEGKYGEIKDEETARKYYNKIEIDLCSSLLFYCIAMEGTYDDNDKLDENVKEYYKVISSDMLEIEKVYKLLCNHMSLIKSMIEQFKREHPAAILHNRLNCLYSYEYDHIVERLKIKILKCINETNFCKLTKTFDCEEDVLQFSACIVELFDNSDIEEYVTAYMNYKNQVNINENRLYRKDLIEFINSKFNYRKDNISKLTVNILNEIYLELLKYKYKSDDRFYTYGRRDFLQKEIDFYLSKNQLVDAFVNFYQYAEANTWIDLSAIPENLNVQEVLDNDYKYKEDGIICEQEKNKIIEIIKALKDGVDGKELSAVSDNNKKVNIYGREKERKIKLEDGTVIGREYYIDSDNDVEESKDLVSSDELSKIFDELFPNDETADSEGEK